MKARDAIIVGGGPAGLAAAIALRLRGLDVLVAEALTPAIDKACGEGLMPDSRCELAKLGLELSPAAGVEFDGIHFSSGRRAAKESVTAEFPVGRGIGVRRIELHARMAEHARELGVELAWGARVGLKDGHPVQVNGEPARYRYLIGADGQSSRVRQWAGLGNGNLVSRRFGLRRHYRVAPWSSNVEVHWGVRGQAYVTPVGENEVCIATLTRVPGLTADALLEEMPMLQTKLKAATLSSRPRGSLTTTRTLDRVTADGVALIGDASGSADAVTGEGLAIAFRQAVMLADSISAGGLERYQAGHGAILKMPQTMARILLTMDRWPLLRHRAMRMLSGNPSIFAGMLGVHVGEESIRHFIQRQGWQVATGLIAPASSTLDHAAVRLI